MRRVVPIRPPQSISSQRGMTLAVLLTLVGLSYMGLQAGIDELNYRQGEAAYQGADCETAIARFDRIIHGQRVVDVNDYLARSQSHKTECLAFMETLQQSANLPSFLVGAEDFVGRYPGSPLSHSLQQTVGQLLPRADLSQVAEVEVCDRLDSMATQRLVSEPQVPEFQLACGQTYTAARLFDQAIATYQDFLQTYPAHARLMEAETALAKVMVTQANAAGAGKISQPGISGYAPEGTAVVVVRNDSPEKMRIIFSGADPRFEELEPCTDCQPYQGRGPETCPNRGPVGAFRLKPGDYGVLVRSISDGTVTPFTGEWNLESGMEYNSCFFLVTQPEVNS